MAQKKRSGHSKLAAQSAETRQRLIQAALELLPKHGFHALSLDTIAAHVGMTKGAIYGSFPSKYALITEALGTQPGLRPDLLQWPKGRHGSVRKRMRRLGEAVLVGLEGSTALAPASIELVLHALRDAEARQQRLELGPDMRSLIEEKLLGLFTPDELPMPTRAFSLLLSLLIPGLLFAHAYEGNVIDAETVLEIFEGFAAAADS